MAVENFTTYTEVDPNSRISKTATRITWASMTRDETAYVYKDFGAGYFGGDFTHTLTVNTTAINYTDIVLGVHWAVANSKDSWWDLKAASGDELSLYIAEGSGGVTIALSEIDSGTAHTDSVTYIVGTVLYLKIIRDETVGTYGTLYCYIYSDVARTVLLNTLTLTLHTSKKDFRYLYGFQSYGVAANTGDISSYTENLSLYAADAGYAATYPSDPISRVTSLIHRYDRGTYTLEMNLGEVVADFGLPEWESKPRTAVEPTPEEKQAFQEDEARRLRISPPAPEEPKIPEAEKELREADPGLWRERDRIVREEEARQQEALERSREQDRRLWEANERVKREQEETRRKLEEEVQHMLRLGRPL